MDVGSSIVHSSFDNIKSPAPVHINSLNLLNIPNVRATLALSFRLMNIAKMPPSCTPTLPGIKDVRLFAVVESDSIGGNRINRYV